MMQTSKLSNEAEQIISELKNFSGYNIKNTDDLTLLIEFSFTNERLFGEIIFTAKYLNGLERVLKRFNQTASIEDREESLNKLRDEYRKNILIFIGLLRKLLNDNKTHVTTANFERKYLSPEQNSMTNLISLISDLSWVKKFYNSKRK